jgi:hypothetical protein
MDRTDVSYNASSSSGSNAMDFAAASIDCAYLPVLVVTSPAINP